MKFLQHSGKKTFVGGNIGNPLIEYAEGSQKDDFIVAEISSFQLQWIEKFRPFIAIAFEYYLRSCQLSRVF
ncbi:MAG: hypothetical protein MZU91_13905 [Desulfosudis oleivorans]|nr:hypothetical protein [Desulfosudis oleivorans]